MEFQTVKLDDVLDELRAKGKADRPGRPPSKWADLWDALKSMSKDGAVTFRIEGDKKQVDKEKGALNNFLFNKKKTESGVGPFSVRVSTQDPNKIIITHRETYAISYAKLMKTT